VEVSREVYYSGYDNSMMLLIVAFFINEDNEKLALEFVVSTLVRGLFLMDFIDWYIACQH
jgi:hypothetical protein